MFLGEEKGEFPLLFFKGYLTSRGWVLELDYSKPLKQSTPKNFILSDNRTKGASAPVSPDKQMFLGQRKGGFPFYLSKGYLTSRGWALELDYSKPLKQSTPKIFILSDNRTKGTSSVRRGAS
jgi:hypothetical protein